MPKSIERPVVRVAYPNPTDPEAEPIVVKRLPAHAAREYAARRTLELLKAAYEHEFEPPHSNLVPAGTIGRRFRPEDDQAVRAQAVHMRQAIGHGAAYWIVTAPSENSPKNEAIIALSKTSPSRATPVQKARLVSPNCYVNDVVVAPEAQRHRLGSMVLYTAIKFGDYDLERQGALDAYRDTASFGFWEQTAFNATEGPVPEFPMRLVGADDEHEAVDVTMVRLDALRLANVVESLEAQTPVLTAAVAMYDE